MLTHSELNAAQKRAAARKKPLGPTGRLVVNVPRAIYLQIAEDAAAAHCTTGQMAREYVLRGALATKLVGLNLPVAQRNDVA
jgi:hypothetical protein